jgi:hypothetical protein
VGSLTSQDPTGFHGLLRGLLQHVSSASSMLSVRPQAPLPQNNIQTPLHHLQTVINKPPTKTIHMQADRCRWCAPPAGKVCLSCYVCSKYIDCTLTPATSAATGVAVCCLQTHLCVPIFPERPATPMLCSNVPGEHKGLNREKLQGQKYTARRRISAVFWDVSRRGLIINRCFGGTCRLLLQGRRNNVQTEEETRSYETSVYNKPTRRPIPEDLAAAEDCIALNIRASDLHS